MLEGGNSSKMIIDSGNRKNQILIKNSFHPTETEAEEKVSLEFHGYLLSYPEGLIKLWLIQAD